MTVYYPKHTDALTLDYTIGTCLILIFLVSTTLNPLSFLYHIQRDSKLSSRLYALLALLDFIVNIFIPLFQAHNFLKKTEDSSTEVELQARIVQGLANVSSWLSQIVINVIIFVRFFTIKFPFERPRQKFVWILVACVTIHLIAMETITSTFYNYWFSIVQLVTVQPDKINKSLELAYTILVVAPTTGIYILGGISSIYTVFLLTRDTGPSETREQKRKSVRIILTLSVINLSVLTGMIYITSNWPGEDSKTADFVVGYFLVNGMAASVSVLDPITILILSKDFRYYIRNLMKGFLQRLRSLTDAENN